ncbi:MAG: hypothetical protein R3324_05695, partial [Halobacteriales archaeon]|nr:hypothetical protein [Halobacteriales archaeon]
TSGLETGRYTLEADDGRNRPSLVVEIRGEEPIPSPTETRSPTPPITVTPPQPTQEPATTVQPATPTAVPGGQPGFGFLIAVAAVGIGIGLIRRRAG